MEKLKRLTAEHRENLAAYLDGELDDSMTRQIETVLSQSTVARNDVELLAKTYELLDLLPRPRASEEFSEKTLSIAKLGEVRPDYRRSPWYRRTQRGLRWFGWTAVLLAAACLGYAVAHNQMRRQDDLLLDDLDVIRHLNQYEEAGSIGFLRQLAREQQLLERISPENDHAAQ